MFRVKIEFRVVVVIVAIVLLYIITAVLGYNLSEYLSGDHSQEVFRSFYASWVEDIIFFSLIGFTVLYVTLRRPEKENFDERISILYSGGSIPKTVIDYNSNIIKSLGAYSPNAFREVIVEEYNKELECYKLLFKTNYMLKNLFKDVAYEDKVNIGVIVDNIDGLSEEMGRVLSIKIGDKENIKSPALISRGGFQSEIPLYIEAGGKSKIVVEFWMWCKINEEQSLIPHRVVDTFIMEIVNRCDINLRIQEIGGGDQIITLLYNLPVTLGPIHGITPQEKIFQFKLLNPEDG